MKNIIKQSTYCSKILHNNGIREIRKSIWGEGNVLTQTAAGLL